MPRGYPFGDPPPIVERQVMTGIGMLDIVRMPCPGQPLRAVRIHQGIAQGSQYQHACAWRLDWRAIAGGSHQLSERVGCGNRMIAANCKPIIDDPVLTGGSRAGQAQDGRFPYPVRSGQKQVQQGRVPARTQTVMERAVGPQARVDQDAGRDFVRMRICPSHGNHCAEGHRQDVERRLQSERQGLAATMARDVLDSARAPHAMQASCARQIDCGDPAARQCRSQQLGEASPMAALTREAAQQNPASHRRFPQYHSAMASSRCRSRSGPAGTHR